MKILPMSFWLEIGKSAKRLRDEINLLDDLTMNQIKPRRKFERMMCRIRKIEGQIRSDLEDHMFEQHPSLTREALKIFYGELKETPEADVLFVRHTNVQGVGIEKDQGTSDSDRARS